MARYFRHLRRETALVTLRKCCFPLEKAFAKRCNAGFRRETVLVTRYEQGFRRERALAKRCNQGFRRERALAKERQQGCPAKKAGRGRRQGGLPAGRPPRHRRRNGRDGRTGGRTPPARRSFFPVPSRTTFAAQTPSRSAGPRSRLPARRGGLWTFPGRRLW